jgi:indolepyruvate ferredoxin oxidoreductase
VAPDVSVAALPEPNRPAAAAVLIAGVGGTGVVTVAQVLATAANIDGLVVSSVDQTGMAQKGGPVVSHLRIGAAAMTGAARVEAGGADAFLAFDLLTGVGPAVLARLDPERTVVVASTSATPTGVMVADVERADHPSAAGLRARLDGHSRRDSNLYLDAEEAALDALGSGPAANFVVVGAAYQRGLLPVSADAVEQALELNGVAVGANVAAFRLGRSLAAGSDVVTGPVSPGPPTLSEDAAGLVRRVQADSVLAEVLAWRVPELIAYQDRRYARRYVEVVARAREVELGSDDRSSGFSTVVAERLFQLMAYKDEYEVARLHRAPALREEVARTFGSDARVTYLLQPPLATHLGLRRKLRVGRRTAGVAFGVLTGMKRLRGTSLDPFGRTAERRGERAAIDEYVALVARLEPLVAAGRREDAVRIAGLVAMVRGFASVKARNQERYQRALTEELAGQAAMAAAGWPEGRTEDDDRSSGIGTREDDHEDG